MTLFIPEPSITFSVSYACMIVVIIISYYNSNLKVKNKIKKKLKK